MRMILIAGIVAVIGGGVAVGALIAAGWPSPRIDGCAALESEPAAPARWLPGAVSGAALQAVAALVVGLLDSGPGGSAAGWFTSAGIALALSIAVVAAIGRTAIRVLAGVAVASWLPVAEAAASFSRAEILSAALLVCAGAAVAIGAVAVPPLLGRRPRAVVAVVAAAGAALGFAVLVRAPAPTPGPSPASVLTGFPLPPAPGWSTLLTAWRLDPLWLLAAAVALLAIVRGRRGAGAVGGAIAAAAVLVVATSGPPAVLRLVLVDAQLLQVALVGAVVPLLALPALPASLAQRRVTRVLAASAVPLTAAVLLTPLLRVAVLDPLGHQLAIAGLLATGAAAALVVRDGIASAAGRVVGVVAAVAAVGVGVVVAVQPGLAMADWYGAMGWGVDALVTQRRGGAAHAIVVAAVVVALAAVRATRIRRERAWGEPTGEGGGVSPPG